MRGKQLENGEFFTAYYYDIIPTNVIINGKAQYTLDTEAQIFKCREASFGSTSVFQSLKGLEKKLINIGAVWQTNDQKWKIATSNTDIEFKDGGKIIMYGKDFIWEFIIYKTTRQMAQGNSLRAGRFGLIDEKSLPILLEIY